MSTTKEGFSVFYENPEIFNFLQNHGLEGCILYDLDQPKDSWINPKALSVLGFEKQEGYRVISHLQHTIKNFPEHVSEGLTRQGKLSLPTANHGEIQFSYVSLQIPQSGIILIALKEKLNASTIVEQKTLERYAHILEGTDVGAWQWNIQTGEVIFDRKWPEILGYSLEELGEISEDTWSEFAHPDDLEACDELMKAHFRGETDYYISEARMRHKNGHWIWVKDKGKVVSWTKDRQPEWMAGFHEEITEIKARLETKKHFIDQAPTAIAMFDKNLNYLAASNKWIEDYNLQELDILGKCHYDIFPEVKDEWKKIHLECLKGAVRRNDRDSFINKDGQTQWLSWEVKPWYTVDDTIGGLLMSTTDISAKIESEEKRQISEQKFRGSFENAAIGMALLDPNGKWLQVNQRICEITGYSKEELFDLTFQDITHPEDLEADLNLLEELVQGKREFYHMDKRYFHKNGHIVYINLAVSLVRDHHKKPLFFVSQITDISKEKRAEQEINSILKLTKEQNNRLKNFAHIVSHNLRSHSSNFGMLLDLYTQDHPEHSDSEIIKMLYLASTNLKDTIQHLNEVILLNSEENTQVKVDLKQSLKLTIDSVFALLKNSDVKVIDTIPEDIYISAVPAYLESILLNFTTNAIRYRSEDRSSFVKFSIFRKDGKIQLHIEDNGLGIDLNRYGKKLFGMYKTFHNKKDSRGIGLFITKNQIEAMGGKVEVESEVNKGTIFKIQFKPYV